MSALKAMAISWKQSMPVYSDPSKRNNYDRLFISHCQNLSKISFRNHREKQGKLCVKGDIKSRQHTYVLLVGLD